jgi:hypothetical protein
MKKTLLPILLAAICSTAATAQTEKGHFMVGAGVADISAVMQKGGDAIDEFGISIYPRAGYFVKKNWAIGAGIELSLVKTGPDASITYGIQPFTRYYFGSKKTRFFAEAGVGVFGYHVDDEGYRDKNGSGFNFTAGPGISHFINEYIGLETSLMFRGASVPHSSEMQYSPQLSFGFQIYICGHKHTTAKAASPTGQDTDSNDN